MRFILNWSMSRFQTRIIHWWFLRPFSTFLVVESMAVAICGLTHILRAISITKCPCLLTARSLTLKSTMSSLSCLCLAMQSGQCTQRLRALCRHGNRHGLMLGIVHMSVIQHAWRQWYPCKQRRPPYATIPCILNGVQTKSALQEGHPRIVHLVLVH